MAQIEVVRQFIDRINAHDVEGLCALLSPAHRFTDALGAVIGGTATLYVAWAKYFEMVPDYRIVPIRYFVDDSSVAVFGTAEGTFTTDGVLHPANFWRIPAAWRALVENGLILEWHVYADNEPIRKIMARCP